MPNQPYLIDERAEKAPGDAGPKGSGRGLAVAGFLAVLAIPAAAILLHELGHFLVHAAFGYELNELTFASVRSGDPPEGVDPAMADGLSFGAGGAVSLLLVGLALVVGRFVGPVPAVLGVVTFECLRGAVGLAMQLRSLAGSPGDVLLGGFGEVRYLGRALGAPRAGEVLLSWFELLVPWVALVLVIRALPSGGRWKRPLGVAGILVVGLVLWMGVIGPRVLPG